MDVDLALMVYVKSVNAVLLVNQEVITLVTLLMDVLSVIQPPLLPILVLSVYPAVQLAK